MRIAFKASPYRFVSKIEKGCQSYATGRDQLPPCHESKTHLRVNFEPSRERSAASAGAGCVGIGKSEASPVKSGNKIDGRAFQNGGALRVHENLQIVEFQNGITRLGFPGEIQLI